MITLLFLFRDHHYCFYKKNLSKPLPTTSVIIRVYDNFLVLFRTNYISVLDCSSSIQARALESGTCLSAYLLFSRRPGIIIQYRGTAEIFTYRIFIKESNIKKLSLNLHNNFCNDSAQVLCNNGLFCLLFLSVLILLKQFVSKSTKLWRFFSLLQSIRGQEFGCIPQ